MTTSPPQNHYEIIDRSALSGVLDDPVAMNCEDCACPTRVPSRRLRCAGEEERLGTLQNEPLRKATGLHVEKLEDDYSVVFNATGDAGVVVLNAAALALLDEFETPAVPDSVVARCCSNHPEIEIVLGHMISLGLIHPSSRCQNPKIAPSDTLIAWMHITNQCNLGCIYCYVQKTIEHMSPAVGAKAVDAIVRSAISGSYSAVRLKYAGGEPSLRLTRVFSIHDYAAHVCFKRNLTLQAVLLSNGVGLHPKGIQGLKRRDIKVMVSLDGLGALHDIQRPFVNGQGSSAQVLSGIDRLIDEDWLPHLSITVTAGNCDSIEDVVQFALCR